MAHEGQKGPTLQSSATQKFMLSSKKMCAQLRAPEAAQNWAMDCMYVCMYVVYVCMYVSTLDCMYVCMYVVYVCMYVSMPGM